MKLFTLITHKLYIYIIYMNVLCVKDWCVCNVVRSGSSSSSNSSLLSRFAKNYFVVSVSSGLDMQTQMERAFLVVFGLFAYLLLLKRDLVSNFQGNN